MKKFFIIIFVLSLAPHLSFAREADPDRLPRLDPLLPGRGAAPASEQNFFNGESEPAAEVESEEDGENDGQISQGQQLEESENNSVSSTGSSSRTWQFVLLAVFAVILAYGFKRIRKPKA